MGAEFVERFLRDAGDGEEGVDPGVVDETDADFESAGPIHAGEGRVGATPVVQPFDAFVLGRFVAVEPGGESETNELIPAAGFPNDFDVGAVRMRAVIYFEGDGAGGEVAVNEIVRVPFRRGVDFEWKMTEGAPVAGEDVGAVALERGEEFGWGGIPRRNFWPGDVGFEGEVGVVGEFGVGALIGFFLEAQENLARAHGAKAVPVPIQLGNFGEHEW